MKTAIELDHLSVTLGTTDILRNIHGVVPTGHITGLLGPSGAGKTTLMRVLVGLQRPTHGTATLFSHPAGASKLRHMIGYASQSLSIYQDLTVRENLRYFATIYGIGSRRVADVMDAVELERHADQSVGRLSGGERSRASLACALLHSPALLILDEPTVGLDPVLRNQLWQHFRALADSGTTLLISSHVMDEAERCDQLILLRHGRIIAHDTPKHLKASTKTTSIEGAFLKLAGGRS